MTNIQQIVDLIGSLFEILTDHRNQKLLFENIVLVFDAIHKPLLQKQTHHNTIASARAILGYLVQIFYTTLHYDKSRILLLEGPTKF
jgi:hypothetical protein